MVCKMSILTHLLSFFPGCSCMETWCLLASTAPGLCCCKSGGLQGSPAVLGHLKQGRMEGWKRRRVKKNKLGERTLASKNTKWIIAASSEAFQWPIDKTVATV